MLTRCAFFWQSQIRHDRYRTGKSPTTNMKVRCLRIGCHGTFLLPGSLKPKHRISHRMLFTDHRSTTKKEHGKHTWQTEQVNAHTTSRSSTKAVILTYFIDKRTWCFIKRRARWYYCTFGVRGLHHQPNLTQYRTTVSRQGKIPSAVAPSTLA